MVQRKNNAQVKVAKKMRTANQTLSLSIAIQRLNNAHLEQIEMLNVRKILNAHRLTQLIYAISGDALLSLFVCVIRSSASITLISIRRVLIRVRKVVIAAQMMDVKQVYV